MSQNTPTPESETVDAAAADPITPPPGDVPKFKRKGSLWVGIAVAVIGLLIILGALISMPIGWLQLLVFVVGCAVMWWGVDRALKWVFGPSFDLLTWACVAWLGILILAAILAPVLPLQEHADLARALQDGTKPMRRPDVLSPNLLGTNNFGLDLLARVIYGARASLVVALLAVLIGIVFGGAIGMLAGFFRKATDTVVGILTNALLAIPPLILLIALATVLEPNMRNLSFALSLLALPSMVRMARANTLTFAQREFVLAARSMGATNGRLMFKEIMPNVLLPLLSYSMVVVSALIVAESSLSFLGLGIQPPQPSWGNMISEGEGTTFREHPHIVLVPGAVLFLTVFSFNMLGERARKLWDPRQAKL
ncbi:ABC transporter permease [Enemella sp. A6]|uniref:ABC transporter permease n=1 Tax=Enemella sp. A6 TaxID=3440152 RepID=UPI003EBCE80A